MKKILLLLTLTLLMGCKKPGCMDPTALNYNPHATQDDNSCNYTSVENLITGNITENTTLTNDKIWVLSGRVSVVDGVTLTIEPGTIIKGDAGTGANSSCLIIARGGKINAVGTSEQPIIFTSITDDIQYGQNHGSILDPTIRGLWGGVLICGKAPISAPGNTQSFQIEGIPASDLNGLYGGNIDNDDSGIMEYVSIRHGGANIGAGNEINGLTLGGVGSSTILNNIEIVANQDDGIEFFGGKVNISNLLVWNAGDDAIDIDQGFGGSITNSVVVMGESTDHGLEVDGPEGGININPFILDYITLIGSSIECFPSGIDGEIADYRAGAIGTSSNILCKDFGIGTDVALTQESEVTYADGTLVFHNWEIQYPLDSEGDVCVGMPLSNIFYNSTSTSNFSQNASNFATIVTNSTIGANLNDFNWTYYMNH